MTPGFPQLEGLSPPAPTPSTATRCARGRKLPPLLGPRSRKPFPKSKFTTTPVPTGWVRKPGLFLRVDRATRTRARVRGVCACAEVAAKHPESARAARRRGSHDERPQQTQPGRPGGRGQRSRDRQVPAPTGNSTECATSGQCLHGGTCLDGRCRCAPGYQGAACQRRQ